MILSCYFEDSIPFSSHCYVNTNNSAEVYLSFLDRQPLYILYCFEDVFAFGTLRFNCSMDRSGSGFIYFSYLLPIHFFISRTSFLVFVLFFPISRTSFHFFISWFVLFLFYLYFYLYLFFKSLIILKHTSCGIDNCQV